MNAPETLPLPASTYQLLLDAARTWPDGATVHWPTVPGSSLRGRPHTEGPRRPDPVGGSGPAAAGIKHGGQPPQAVPLSTGDPGHFGITDTPIPKCR
jgi:hypothetical protein